MDKIQNTKFILSFLISVLSRKITYYFMLIFFCLLFLSFCYSSKEKLFKETRISMYTIVSITVSSTSKEKAQKAIDIAFKELDRLAGLLNFYSDSSEVSIINKNTGIRPIKVSPETFEIIEKSLYVSKNTDGAFDITLGPVVRLWDFDKKKLPEEKMIKDRLKYVGYENITIDREKRTVFLKKKGMQIDLGGIIKGYAADKAVEILKKNGIKAGIVAVAGDIKTFGKRPDGKDWNVGIQNPRPHSSISTDEKVNNKVDEIIATLGISDVAISTSGDYQKFFIKNSKRYHHLLNPKTGYPVYECQSVTVIARDATFADAFSTGVFILGPNKGLEVLKKLGYEGVIVDKDGKIHLTNEIKNKIKWMKAIK